ncbi:hypothetical protein [Mycolicibacterium fluoranthenivorans]|uniref:PE-PGRS family protein n=1 Tax=Mycolicibacterium fluoranthenivorans TaxID=258505 RepID=A0A1G4X3Q6_9MYCO|nr:hypothetical protein [Mycolicibacterium fluoranthenivorans]SCX34568.1 hypothetical protein SAMN02799620_06380 [Mycolicibacterium fluoranthenivorans]
MQSAMRPYVTAGVALVGASVIAVTPIAAHPNLPQTHMPQVQLTASSIDNPINVFKPVLEDAGSWLNQTVHTVLADPLPILRQIVSNQLYTARQVLEAAKAAGSALGQLGAGLPATLKAAGKILATGDVNGAIDAVINAGLMPILALLGNPWAALQPALERPFKVGQAMVSALYNAGLSMLVGVVASTIGLGFNAGGTPPLLQQIVTSTQKVLDSIKTLNPVNVINAVQHGIADVLKNAVEQAKQFTTGTLPYIGSTILQALRAGLPTTTAPAATAAALPTASAATTVTLAVDATGAAPAATAEKATAATETASATAGGETASAPAAESAEASATDTKATPAEADATVTKDAEPATAVKTPDASPAGSVTAESGSTATKDADTDSSTTTKDATTKDATSTKGAKGVKGAKGGKGSVTRDSVKAEPGTGTTSGGTHASSGTAGASESGSTESAKAGAGAKSSGDSGSSSAGE